MKIREALVGDAPTLAALEAACFSDAWGEGAILSHLASETTKTLIAEKDGAPVGALFLSCLPPEGEVYRLCVLPAHRRGGIGRALMAAGLAAEREAGVAKMFLDVRAGNTAAQLLYREMGFSVSGERKNYYRAPREDAVLMERELFEDEVFGH